MLGFVLDQLLLQFPQPSDFVGVEWSGLFMIQIYQTQAGVQGRIQRLH